MFLSASLTLPVPKKHVQETSLEGSLIERKSDSDLPLPRGSSGEEVPGGADGALARLLLRHRLHGRHRRARGPEGDTPPGHHPRPRSQEPDTLSGVPGGQFTRDNFLEIFLENLLDIQF